MSKKKETTKSIDENILLMKRSILKQQLEIDNISKKLARLDFESGRVKNFGKNDNFIQKVNGKLKDFTTNGSTEKHKN